MKKSKIRTIGSLEIKYLIEFYRQMIMFLAGQYVTTKNNLRKNAPKVYMKYFPIIQGVTMDIYLLRMSELFSLKRLNKLSKLYFKSEIEQTYKDYRKSKGGN